MITSPKVFISYSWTSNDYKSLVLQLAKDLMHDGVEVILDQWDLRSGHDKFAFMEQSIARADKVLILCDKVYVEKANDRIGGVGTETAIITPDVYGHYDQEKFIPVVMESFEVMPMYLRNRIGIDLKPGNRKKGYKELLRVIYEKPVNPKPEIGSRPRWLDEPTLDTRLNMFAELFDDEDDVTPGVVEEEDDANPLPEEDDPFEHLFKIFKK